MLTIVKEVTRYLFGRVDLGQLQHNVEVQEQKDAVHDQLLIELSTGLQGLEEREREGAGRCT